MAHALFYVAGALCIEGSEEWEKPRIQWTSFFYTVIYLSEAFFIPSEIYTYHSGIKQVKKARERSMSVPGVLYPF